MKVALDINRYVDFCKGDTGVRDTLERAERIVLPFVVLAELRAGFRLGRHGAENERLLQELLLRDDITPLFPDAQTTHRYASVLAQLRAQGTPIPTHDIWIAALVLQHDLTLCARDAHFDALPQLPRV